MCSVQVEGQRGVGVGGQPAVEVQGAESAGQGGPRSDRMRARPPDSTRPLIVPPAGPAASVPPLSVRLPVPRAEPLLPLPSSQHAGVDGRAAAVGVAGSEGQRAVAHLGQAAGTGKRSRRASRHSRPYRRSLRRRWCPASWAELVENPLPAWSVPPLKLKAAAPEP